MKPTKFDKAIQKELKYISIRERRLFNKAQSKDTIKSTLEEKVPKKTRTMLEDAFGKAFEIVFEKGVGIIEKTYNRQTIMTDYEVNDSIVDIKKAGVG